MDHIPVGAVLLLTLVDLAILEMLSVFLGLVVARATGSPLWKGMLLGVLVPFVGPLIWAAVSVARDKSIVAVRGGRRRSAKAYGAAGALAIAALLFLIATPRAWGEVAGGYEKYAFVGDAAAMDSLVGIIATVGTSFVLLVGLVALLQSSAQGRVAILVAVVGAGWLLVTVDGLITFSAVNDLSQTVHGLTGGRAAAEVAPRGGLWITLAGSLFALAVAPWLIVVPGQRISVLLPVSQAPAPFPPVPLQDNFDYGDGF
jgi:hypothetical protein